MVNNQIFWAAYTWGMFGVYWVTVIAIYTRCAPGLWLYSICPSLTLFASPATSCRSLTSPLLPHQFWPLCWTTTLSLVMFGHGIWNLESSQLGPPSRSHNCSGLISWGQTNTGCLKKNARLRLEAYISSLEAAIGTCRDIFGFLRFSAFIWAQEQDHFI